MYIYTYAYIHIYIYICIYIYAYACTYIHVHGNLTFATCIGRNVFGIDVEVCDENLQSSDHHLVAS